jgi:hypothetical protein
MNNQSLITAVPSRTALVDIQRQATRVVNVKRLRDTWDACRRLRACGCLSYTHTLVLRHRAILQDTGQRAARKGTDQDWPRMLAAWAW